MKNVKIFPFRVLSKLDSITLKKIQYATQKGAGEKPAFLTWFYRLLFVVNR